MDSWLVYIQLAGSLGTVVMAGVWLVYLQIFYRDLRRRHQPRLVLELGDGAYSTTPCLLINMSTGHVNVMCVLVVGYTEQGRIVHHLRQAEYRQADEEAEDRSPVRSENLKQGPLSPGSYLVLGTFDQLIRQLLRSGDEQEVDSRWDTIQAIEVRALFLHGVSDQPIGACRQFQLRHKNGSIAIQPRTLQTRQLASRREAKRVYEWYRQSLAEQTDEQGRVAGSVSNP